MGGASAKTLCCLWQQSSLAFRVAFQNFGPEPTSKLNREVGHVCRIGTPPTRAWQQFTANAVSIFLTRSATSRRLLFTFPYKHVRSFPWAP